MVIRKIARLGHPVLLRPAEPVTDLGDPEIRRLVADMRATLDDARGLGLAAPQVYQPLRIVLVRPAEARDSGPEHAPYLLANPELEPIGEAVELGFEGCLSIPELRGAVPRHASVAYRGLDEHGTAVEGVAHGLHARILQHEVDHLDGILFPMRMRDLRLLAFTSELEHLEALLRPAEEEVS